MGTRISSVVERKGSMVATIAPSASVGEAAQLLEQFDVGALVVSGDGHTVEGLVSERDIVRRLASVGSEILEVRVEELMSSPVTTCTMASTTDELAVLMTDRRIRHIPVLDDGALVAIVSIGDIVKSRLEELSLETEELQAYVSGHY